MSYKPTIVIVDDDENILNSLSALLRKSYQIITSSRASDAYNIVTLNPEVLAVIADYMMPQETGLELFASLKNFSYICKVLITGIGDYNTAIEAINVAKVDYFLTKPIDYKELLKILDNSLGARALTKLTLKERQIVSMLTTGMSSREITHLLRISPITFSVHKGNILKKLKIDRDKVFSSLLASKLSGDELTNTPQTKKMRR